jgi:hypothetical protein
VPRAERAQGGVAQDADRGTRVGQDRYEYDYDDAHGQGLVTLAGVMLMIAASRTRFMGSPRLTRRTSSSPTRRYVSGDLSTWGWFLVALGVVQCFAAFAIWRGAAWGRWFGVACASANVILLMLWIPAYPVFAMTILAFDIIVIYGLLAYGGRRRAALAACARAGRLRRLNTR